MNDILNGFDLPAVVPNDVYQVAATIINELKNIRQKQNITVEAASNPASSAKSPADVYTQTELLLTVLKDNCASNALYCPKNGISITPKPQGIINPAHVLDALNNILADINSIKVKIGLSSPTKLTSVVSGKTPTSVFDILLEAQALANTIK